MLTTGRGVTLLGQTMAAMDYCLSSTYVQYILFFALFSSSWGSSFEQVFPSHGR